LGRVRREKSGRREEKRRRREEKRGRRGREGGVEKSADGGIAF
jgi:hypothetical protein